MANYILPAVVFVVIFSILVLVHELGHFIMAKRAGIKVEEFGFGLPPRMFGKKVGETIYSVNWVPFGGFVRMFGEDSKKASMLKNKRSFMAKPARSRFLVIVAGVVMNFLLAWILLTVGFSIGIKPLLLPEEVFTAIDNGQIVLQEGLKIKTVEEGGFFDKIGFKTDDIIVSFNDKELTDDIVAAMEEKPAGIYKIFRDGKIYKYDVKSDDIPADFEKSGFQAKFYDAVSFPRVEIFKTKSNSPYAFAGMMAGDAILSVDGAQVYGVRDFEELIRGKSKFSVMVFRGGLHREFLISMPQKKQVIVESVFKDFPAEGVLAARDVVLFVNGRSFGDVGKLVEYIKTQKGKEMNYVVERNGEKVTAKVTVNDEGRIGVFLSDLVTYGGDSGITLYDTDVYSSVVEVKDQVYPVYTAAHKSLSEMWKLSKVTAVMFIEVMRDIFGSGTVPDGVAGPVGIASMTSVLVKEGFMPILRFIALLSLSLAVINILPLPALDGGRLLFLVVEFIIGRRVSQRLESLVHGIGYVLILFLVVMVTYSDVVKLFAK